MYGRFFFISIIILIFLFSSCLSVEQDNHSDRGQPSVINEKNQEMGKTGLNYHDPGSNKNDTTGEEEPGSGDSADNEEDSGETKDFPSTEDGPAVPIAAPRSSPDPLHLNEALKKIKEFVQPPEYLISNNNNLLSIVHDFTSDGVDEICVVGIESENADHARLRFLSDFSRLYAQKIEVFPFFLYIFSVKEGMVQKLKKLELGEQAVYESMTKFGLYKGKSNPAVITINFFTREGSAQHWYIFKSPQVTPVSQLLLTETFSSKALVEDINSDGLIDIVLFERGMEEGIGYETFLTWKRWNGRRFFDYKTSNIVRNLNTFLLTIKELSLKGDISSLISYSFDPKERKKLEKQGLSEKEILFHFLGFSRFFMQGELPDFNVLEDIHDIIFPEMLDNPFYIRDEKGFYVKLSFRIIYANGVSLIPEVFIYMLKNPFEKQQFVLCPVPPVPEGTGE